MGFFNFTIAAQAEGRRPHAAILTEHDFPEGYAYNWTGLGDLDLDGHTWIGRGDLVTLGALPSGTEDAAVAVTDKLSGVAPEFVTEARSQPPVRGRSQIKWLQFFDPDTLQPLDTKYLLADRIMDVMGYSGIGPNMRTISLTTEDIWTGLNTSEHANWSAADQDALFPGDKGLDFVAEMVPGIRVEWPAFDAL